MKSKLTFIITFFILTLAVAEGSQQLKVPHIPKEACFYPLGPMETGKHLHLAISLPLRHNAERDQLIQSIYDPKSPNYQHYLTPQEFTQRFSPSQADYDAVVSFFKDQGYKVTISPSRTLLDIDGTVKMIEATFHTTLREYKLPTEDRIFYAPDVSPSVDLGILLSDVQGLENYHRIRPLWGNHMHLKRLLSTGVSS